MVVDDESGLRDLLRVSLIAHGYTVETGENGAAGIVLAAGFQPDLLILDLGLPDMDGKAVVRRVREWSIVPILVLTVRDQEQEKIEALDAGADDYVTKPFGMGELLARVRVLLRRSVTPDSSPVITCGELELDLTLRRVTVRGQEVKLTPTEYELIRVLAQNAGRVLTHNQLLQAVWGESYAGDTHYIRIYIGQLRRKIEANPTQPQYIQTESGVGYRLVGSD